MERTCWENEFLSKGPEVLLVDPTSGAVTEEVIHHAEEVVIRKLLFFIFLQQFKTPSLKMYLGIFL